MRFNKRSSVKYKNEFKVQLAVLVYPKEILTRSSTVIIYEENG